MAARITKIPIYGHLFVSKREWLLQALADLFVTTAFSLLPIWMYPIAAQALMVNPPAFGDSVLSTVSGGELFIYSAALVGPLIYSIVKKYSDPAYPDGETKSGFTLRRKYEFPYGGTFILLAMFICVFAALFFGAIKAAGAPNIQFPLDRKTLFQISLYMYLFTLSCFYCVSVYRLNLENVTADFGDDTRELKDQWKKSHG